MKPAAERLYELLPAIHRLRDAAEGEPLKALIEVIAEQVSVLEDDLAQLYDNQFIETCAPWVAPYLGDLIGYPPLHGVIPRIRSPRAEIANTIGYRRRKGTAAMLEQVARDVSGWHARVVEFFQRLATTQHLNHIRAANRSPDLREWEPLERLDTPFEQLNHTIDVRRIARGRGRHNIPNVGVFLWRLHSHSWTDAQPRALDAWRYWCSPLGLDGPLFTRPEPKPPHSGLSTRMHVPDPISRRTLEEYPDDYYGGGRSLQLTVNGVPVGWEEIVVCDLSDTESGRWAQHPAHRIGLDPVLGRIAFPRHRPPPSDLRVTFHHGFSAEMGGGEYDRSRSVPAEFLTPGVWHVGVAARRPVVDGELYPTLRDALDAWKEQRPGTLGVITVMDASTYAEELAVRLPEDSRLLIIAAEWPEFIQPDGSRRRVRGRFNAIGCRPHLRGAVSVQGSGERGGRLFLNGLLIEGPLDASGAGQSHVALRHCTVVPGRGYSREGYPIAPREPSILVSGAGIALRIEHSIVGGIRVGEDSTAVIADSIVDSTSRCGVAYAAADGFGPGGTLRLENTTVIGKVHTVLMELASNVIFFSRLAARDDWVAPVICTRRQEGCIRFSFVPLEARTPRRYQCHPVNEEEASRVTPQFTSTRYGDPGYAQLSLRGPQEIFRGADDESEMGAFHELFEPQRITNVEVRLQEYLRFGLEAGLFFEPRLESRRPVPNAYTYTKWVDLCEEADAEPLPGIGAGLI